MTLILDSSALLAIALNEPAADVVLNRMQNTSDGVLIHAVNATEVAYKLMLKGVPEDAAWEATSFGGLQRISDVSDVITHAVARLKTTSPFLSLADCFCLALGEYLEADVITSDGRFQRATTLAKVFIFRQQERLK